jgi:pyruvate/2-oxoglutarate/acetoin dehydrogenase E1 component
MSQTMTFAGAIQLAIREAMERDPNVICYGLGVPDPKGVFGTTTGLQDQFGSQRVFDMPTSENAMTGVGIGAALNGIRSVMTHQRMDFFLLAMDQLVNNAAKWHYMFGGSSSVPITLRLILGRGWGQGPTHAQNLQSWLIHVPGLKVVMPCTPADARGLLLESIFDPDPVVFLEHRWLHQQKGEVPGASDPVSMGRARIVREGNQITLVGFSYMIPEALHAAEWLALRGIDCEVLDLRTLRPLDWLAVEQSVKKTGHLLALDTGNPICSVASEIIAHASIHCWESLKAAPRRLALQDAPSPTSPALTRGYHPGAAEIAQQVLAIITPEKASSMEVSELIRQPHDVPGDWFQGPF